MEITFLGTGAAEGYPSPWCDCANCAAARARGGRDLRGRSAALINDDLLIDLGPDLVGGAARAGRSLAAVRHILITHSHSDHLYLPNLEIRDGDYRPAPLARAELGAGEDVLGLIQAGYPQGLDRLDLDLRAIAPGQGVRLGRYTVLAVPAAHGDATMRPLLYAIGDGAQAVFYGTDTGPLAEETWALLRGWRFGALILDETMGFTEPEGGHMAVASFEACVARFQAEGLLAPGALVIAHHFSHWHNPGHAKLEAYFGPRGVTVAYDGLRLTL